MHLLEKSTLLGKKKNLGNWDADWAERLKSHLPGVFL